MTNTLIDGTPTSASVNVGREHVESYEAQAGSTHDLEEDEPISTVAASLQSSNAAKRQSVEANKKTIQDLNEQIRQAEARAEDLKSRLGETSA